MGSIALVLSDGELTGSVDGRPVRATISGRRRHSRWTGSFLGNDTAAEWSVGSNHNNPDPVSELHGTTDGAAVSINARVHLGRGPWLRWADVEGSVADQEIRVQVRPVEAPAYGPTIVEIDGAFGALELTLYAALEGDGSGARVQGLVAGKPMLLAGQRRDGVTIEVSGEYVGPPDLLQLLVGALLHVL